MMKMLRATLVVNLCLIALGFGSNAYGALSLTLDPSNGAVTGPAGSTVGWGFTLTNASDFAVITGSDFCVGILSSPCSNSFGTYTDFAGAQFLVIGPSPEQSSITQAFDDTSMTGAGSFAINPTSVGTLAGYIAMTYDLYSVSPNAGNFDPTADLIATGQYLYAPASVTVGTAVTPAPEPSTLLLLSTALGAFWIKKKLRIRQV